MTFVGQGAAERFDVRADGDGVRLTRDLGDIVMALSGAERIGALLNSGGDHVTVGDLSGTGMTGSDWSFGALDGTPDVLRVDGTRRDDQIVVTQGATNPAGTSTSATISGIPAPVLVTGVQPDDGLEVDGLGGQDTIDASSILPGAFSFTFVQ